MRTNTIAILLPRTIYCYECGETIRHCDKCQYSFRENDEILCNNKKHYCPSCANGVKI